MTADPYEADWSNDQGPVVSQAAPNLDESEAGEHAGTSDSNETANRAGSLMPWLAVLALAVIAAEWGCTSVGVQFSQPWLLLLLIPAGLFLYYAYKSDFRLNGFRKKLALFFRTCVILLLILMISGLHGFTVLRDKQVVYLADRSDSMGIQPGSRAGLTILSRQKARRMARPLFLRGLRAL